ncbi:unnamed protein product [Closterium sp. Naga37s-1]|nr:unnamed protein product [Closterium sp. Naga37s-1]
MEMCHSPPPVALPLPAISPLSAAPPHPLQSFPLYCSPPPHQPPPPLLLLPSPLRSPALLFLPFLPPLARSLPPAHPSLSETPPLPSSPPFLSFHSLVHPVFLLTSSSSSPASPTVVGLSSCSSLHPTHAFLLSINQAVQNPLRQFSPPHNFPLPSPNSSSPPPPPRTPNPLLPCSAQDQLRGGTLFEAPQKSSPRFPAPRRTNCVEVLFDARVNGGGFNALGSVTLVVAPLATSWRGACLY